MSSRILIVDDDPPVRRMLARTLAADGRDVTCAADGVAALIAVEQDAPDTVILDVTMPGLDGLAVCRRMRDMGLAAPILLLTARDGISDRVAGLDAGADDYLVKPFASAELLARLRALQRRQARSGRKLRYGDLVLDVEQRSATRAGQVVELTEREAELLEFLLVNQGNVVSRESALAQVWREAAGDNVVDRYVGYLRRKLGQPQLIHTVRGRGFVLRR